MLDVTVIGIPVRNFQVSLAKNMMAVEVKDLKPTRWPEICIQGQ